MIKLSTPIEKYGKNGVAAHWLADQLWCEKQLEFKFEYGEKKREEEIIGTQRHSQLHKEIAELIPVKTITTEDEIAVRLHNAQVGIIRLKATGLTRELPVFGRIDSIFVLGMIDELRIKNEIIEILDHKTRRGKTMPRMEQMIPSEFQLMLYYKLLEDSRLCSFTHNDLMSFYNFDQSTKISKEFEEEIVSKEIQIESNINKLAKTTFKLFPNLPDTSKELTILYECQQIRKLIGEHRFKFDEKKFAEYIDFSKDYWLGEREAVKVSKENLWKCNYCEFKLKCSLDKSQTSLLQF